MEWKLKTKKDQVARTGRQLVTENERPNEDINAGKKQLQFSIEHQLESVKQKMALIVYPDVESERRRIQGVYDQNREFLDFCADAEHIRDLVQY